MSWQLLPRQFYCRDTVIVAKELLGKIIIRTVGGKVQRGMITETEAYRSSDDPACHAYRGKTVRTEPLFGPVGHTYIYFIYGNHFCMNIVSKDSCTPAGGVLIRAIKFLNQDSEGERIDGPGRLTRALEITKHENNLDVTVEGPLFITEGNKIAPEAIICTPRIGISMAKDRLWRFYVEEISLKGMLL